MGVLSNKGGLARNVLLVGLSATALGGCARIQAMSRADPASITVYPGGLSEADIIAQRRSATRAQRGSAARGRGGDGGAQQTAAPMQAVADPNRGCPLVRGVDSFRPGAINLDCFRFPEHLPQAEGTTRLGPLAYALAAGMRENSDRPPRLVPVAGDAETRSARVYRNRLTSILLTHSDQVCTMEMGRLTANEATANVSLNILSSALSGATSVITGTLADNILAATGGLATASRAHVNADIYRNTFAYAISRAVTLERQQLRTAIEADFAKSTDDFTIDDAIRRVNAYHGTCSFYRGLELVLASVEHRDQLGSFRDARARALQMQELREALEIVDRTLAAMPAAAEGRAALETRRGQIADQIGALAMSRREADGDDGTEGAGGGQPQQNQQQPGQQGTTRRE